jgi:hypothetical protein
MARHAVEATMSSSLETGMGLKKAYRPGALRRTACQPHNSTTESAAMPNTMNANILSIRA